MRDYLHAEVAREFAATVAGRMEFFPRESYSFQRLGKLEQLDPKLVNALYWRKWRAANPKRAADYARASVERVRTKDPERFRELRRGRKARYRQRHRDRANAAQRAAYARRVAAKKAGARQ